MAVDTGLLTAIGTLTTAAAVVVAVVFGVHQVRAERVRRADAATVQMIQSGQTPEVRQAFLRVLEIPEGTPAEAIASDPALVDAADTLVYFMDPVGLLVHRGVLPLDAVDYHMGGHARRAWTRLAPYFEAKRREMRHPNYGEWFQWVAERMAEHPAPQKHLGAHVAFKDWRP